MAGAPHLLGNKLQQQFAREEFCDVTLVVTADEDKASEAVKFRCHKLVLAAWSDVFAAMFKSGMKEEMTDVVEIASVNPDAMQSLINYCYSEHLDIEPGNALEILQAADRFNISSAVSLCEQAMQDAVTAETCWSWLAAASAHHFTGLEEHCRDFICRNFSNLIQMHHFLEADADQLMRVLEHDGLVCLNEFQVFKAAMTWISNSPATRAVHVPRLLDTIRFKNMSEGDLAEAQEDLQASQHPLFWRKVAEGYKNIRQDNIKGIPRRYQEVLRGVLLNIPTEVIEAAGWVPVYVEPYSHKTTMSELDTCMYRLNEGKPFKYIIVGARESTTPQLSLCALGRTETVLKQTAGNNTVAENGVYWYCNPEKSFGFSPTPNVFLNSSDVLEDDAARSLRWRLDKFPGERAGKHKGLYSSTMAEIWTKICYAATSLDNVLALSNALASLPERPPPRSAPFQYSWDQ